MSQEEYEAIIKCIHFAMPIAEMQLVTAFNRIIHNSNEYLDIQAEKAKATKTTKTTKKTKKGE